MKEPLPDIDPVQLKPVFGMKPGLWLTILYLVIFCILLFLIGFLPGIRKGGRYITFTAPVPSAGLYVDGQYMGPADYQYFIPSGEHEIRMVKADTAVAETSLKVDHPVFFTWLVHRTGTCSPSLLPLSESQKRGIIEFDLQEIAQISQILHFTPVTVYPPVFTRLKDDVTALEYDEEVYALAAAYITTPEMLADAKTIECQDPLFEKVMGAAMASVAARGGMAGKSGECNPALSPSTLSTPLFTVEGVEIEPCEFVMGKRTSAGYPQMTEAGVKRSTDRFSIALQPVSQRMWGYFIEENPVWSVKSVDDMRYLPDQSPSSRFSGPEAVYGISAEAAEAFCRWLSEKTGRTVCLPTEEMWTLAAEAGVCDSMYYEYTSSPFIPLERVVDDPALLKLFSKYNLKSDIIVKHCADINKVGPFPYDQFGELESFRIAWK